jgi:hypothetical protein
MCLLRLIHQQYMHGPIQSRETIPCTELRISHLNNFVRVTERIFFRVKNPPVVQIANVVGGFTYIMSNNAAVSLFNKSDSKADTNVQINPRHILCINEHLFIFLTVQSFKTRLSNFLQGRRMLKSLCLEN